MTYPSDNDIRIYGGWYCRVGEAIRKRFGVDAELFIDLLAATSPRNRVRKNWRTAIRIYQAYQHGEDFLVGVMKSHRPNVWRALRREPLSGDKVRRFAENLKGNTDAVTIDVWICRALGIDHNRLDKGTYEKTERLLRLASYRAGCTPCEYQAALWQVQRMASGRKPISFMAAIDDERQMNLWKD